MPNLVTEFSGVALQLDDGLLHNFLLNHVYALLLNAFLTTGDQETPAALRTTATYTHTHTHVCGESVYLCLYSMCVEECTCLLPRTCTIFTTLPTYSYIRTRLHCGISMPSSATDVAMSILLWSEFWSVLLKESKTPFLLVSVITAAQQHKHTQHMWSKHVTQMKAILLCVNYCESL